MTRTVHWIVPTEPASIDPLIDAVNALDTVYEIHLRAAATVQKRPFGVFIDYLNMMPAPSPTIDPFTFDIDNDELLVFSDEPAVMIDALLEMGMYMQGFSTLLGLEDIWKIQVAIGGWRYVRQSIKESLGIPVPVGKQWAAMVNADESTNLDEEIFSELIRLAGCPALDVLFPEEASTEVTEAYRNLVRVMEVLGQNIGIADHVEFNQRMMRVLDLIEDKLAPKRGGE